MDQSKTWAVPPPEGVAVSWPVMIWSAVKSAWAATEELAVCWLRYEAMVKLKEVSVPEPESEETLLSSELLQPNTIKPTTRMIFIKKYIRFMSSHFLGLSID